METIVIVGTSQEETPPPPQDGDASYSVYICPNEPPVITDNEAHFKVDSAELTFYIRKKDSPTNSMEVRILRDYARYVDDLWRPNLSDYTSWERSYYELVTGYEPDGSEKKEKVFEDSISIKCVPPSDDKYILRSYWKFTTVSGRNPFKLTPHEPFIVKIQRPLSEEFRIPNDQSKDNFWVVSLSNHIHKEEQPIVRPGEYIVVQWSVGVHGRDFLSSGFYGCKYETPLFTGGVILEKWGEGLNKRYVVEIFGVAVCNVVPTDMYEFEVGKWCYLLKNKAEIAMDKPKQDFSSSSIKISDNGSFSGLVGEINYERKRNGRDSLFTNSFLEQAATEYSTDMKNNDINQVSNPDYGEIITRLEDAEYFDLLKPGSSKDADVFTFVYTEKRGVDYGDADLFQTLMEIADFSDLISSSTFREIGISKVTREIKIGAIYYVKSYYTFIVAYRSDGLNVGCAINEDYRITPFNFQGPMSTEMAIMDSYHHELRLDSATEFAKVFDMKKYEAEVKAVNYTNDTISALFFEKLPSGEEVPIEKTVPVFYHCGGVPITEGGSNTFTEGDKAILQVPTDSSGDADWDNAHAFAHIDVLKACYGPVIIVSSWSDCEAFAWDLEKQKPVVEYVKMTEPEGLINNATEFVKDKLADLGLFDEPQLMLYSSLEETSHFTETIEESPYGQPNAYHGNWIPQVGDNPLITPETMDDFDDSFQEELSIPVLTIVNGDGTYTARAEYISVPEYLYHYDPDDLDKHYIFPETEEKKSAYLWKLEGISDLDFIEAPDEPADPFLEAVSDRIRDSIIAEFEAMNPDLLGMEDYSLFLDNRLFLFAHGFFDKEMWDYEKINADPPLDTLPTGIERKLTGIKDNLFELMKQRISVYNTKESLEQGVKQETPDVLMDTWRDAYPFISIENDIAAATLNDNSVRWLSTEGCGIGQSKFHTVLYEAFYVCPKIVLTLEDGMEIDPDTNVNETIMTAGAPITKSLRFYSYIPNNINMKEDMLLSCINTHRAIKNQPKDPDPAPYPLYMPFFITGELQRLAIEQGVHIASIGEITGVGSDGSSFSQRLDQSLYGKYCHPETGEYKAVEYYFQYLPKTNPYEIFKEWIGSTTEEGLAFIEVLESRNTKEELGYTDIAISITETNDFMYICLIFGYRKYHWPGMSPMNTELLDQYIEEHMLFDSRSLTPSNDDGALKAPFFWYVPPKE